MDFPLPNDDYFWFLHFEGDDDGGDDLNDDDDDGGGDPNGGGDDKKKKKTPAGKFYTDDQINDIVVKRSSKARKAQQAALEQLEALRETVNMSEAEKEKLEEQIDTLRKQTLTAEEIAKREAKKAKDLYENQLTQAQESAKTWEQRHNELKINYEINSAAQKHGVLNPSIPFLEAFLRNKVSLKPTTDEESGKIQGFETLVDFNDQGADGKPIDVQLSVDETVKRMKELPEVYGHLFQSGGSGGLGGSSGTPGGTKGGFRPGMTQEEYMKARKENPSAVYGE